MSSPFSRFSWAIRWRLLQRRNDARLTRIAQQVSKNSQPSGKPVVIFNASTRLSGLSLNAGFSLLTAWALRLAGVPVTHFVCHAGLQPCVLGTSPTQRPPCRACIAQSRQAYQGADVHGFHPWVEPDLQGRISGLNLFALEAFEYEGLPLGALVLPSVRWILRRHHLTDDEKTRSLFRGYIQSAWGVFQQFDQYLASAQPRAVVVFNGMFYPEAAARLAARKRGIRNVSHEVALRPLTAYFTSGEATAYPIDIPDTFQLTPPQEARLDDYLKERFQGRFSMAGIQFWPEMRSLSQDFWERASKFEQIVPVFTNVIFDTSQGHANVVFPHMFAWLDLVLEAIRSHPETFFVIRAHPDETRPGKESRESVEDWVKLNGVDKLDNVLFVDSRQYFSSYELIQRSKFVMVYNSTIGLEASILGAPVLCGGKARFTQLPTVFFPETQEKFSSVLEDFLKADKLTALPEHRQNARRFLYAQLFQTSLPLEHFLEEDGIRKGYVRFKDFAIEDLAPDNSPAIRAILDGVLGTGSFLLEG